MLGAIFFDRKKRNFVRSKDCNLFTSLFSGIFILFLYDNHTHILKVGLVINTIFSRFMSDNKRMTFLGMKIQLRMVYKGTKLLLMKWKILME